MTRSFLLSCKESVHAHRAIAACFLTLVGLPSTVGSSSLALAGDVSATPLQASLAVANTFPGATEVLPTPTRNILVSSFECFIPGCQFDNAAVRYDAVSGEFLGEHIPNINRPYGMAVHPRRGTLLVVSQDDVSVSEYNAETGAFIRTFITAGPEGLHVPRNIMFAPDGNILLSSTQTQFNPDKFNGILKFDGDTGAFLAPFIDGGFILGDDCGDPKCIHFPSGMAQGPNGHLYVASVIDNIIIEYDGATGLYIDFFDAPELVSPGSLIVRPAGTPRAGNILVTSLYRDPTDPSDFDKILEFSAATHELIEPGGIFTAGLVDPGPMLWSDDGDVLVVVRLGDFPPFYADRIARLDGLSGVFLEWFIPPTDTHLHLGTAMIQVATGFAGGDYNADLDVDLEDVAHFQLCLGRNPPPSCLDAFDDNLTRTIDPVDFLALLGLFTGPSRLCGGDADCDFGNPCVAYACVAGECVGKPAPDGTSCADDVFCNGDQTCRNGVCLGSIQCGDSEHCDEANDRCLQCISHEECDDGNSCTTDECDTAFTCRHVNNTLPCDNDDLCTTNDVCSDGTCRDGPPRICDDGNLCTDDGCDPQLGCQFPNNTNYCDDRDACTLTDICLFGTCRGGPSPDCDDDNLCTDDLCFRSTGCVNFANAAPCDDDDPCTVGDVCAASVCTPGPPPDCDDEVSCTDDSCLEGDCVHTVNHGICSNALFCDGAEICDPVLDCQIGTDPCPGQDCDEVNGECVDATPAPQQPASGTH